MRLIDADELKSKLLQDCSVCPNNGTKYCRLSCELNYYTHLIDNAPTVQPMYFPPCEDCNKKMNEIRQAYDKMKAMERPHGKWIKHPNPDNKEWDICTHCNTGTKRREYGLNLDGSEYVTEHSYSFCPNCGADMRESNGNAVDNI